MNYKKNQELHNLYNNYNNLTEEQLDRLLILIIKDQKEKLGLSLPINFKIEYNNLKDNNAGGDSSLDYNQEMNRYEYTIRLNGNEWYKQYLLNRNKVMKNGMIKFESSMDSLFILIARLCHELRHSYQNEMTLIKRQLVDPNALIWIKQSLIVTDEKFYRNPNNYLNMPREVDACKYMYSEALNYINLYTTLKQDNKDFYNTLVNTVETQNKLNNVKEIEQLKFIIDGQEISVIEYFNKQMPQALDTIPSEQIEDSILKYIYNSDRTKKSYEQLLSDKEELINNLDKNLSSYPQQIQKVEKIYEFIIESDADLKKQREDNQIKKDLRTKVEQEHLIHAKTPKRFGPILERMGIDINEFINDVFNELEINEEQETVENIERKIM